MPFFLAVNNGAASFNIFSSPPPIPSNLNTATRTPSPPLPMPTPLPRKHPRKDDKGEEKQRQSENGKEKGKGKQVYKHRGWYTTKVGEEKGVIVGDEGGVSYKVAGAPFEFKFSYSETPKVSPLALREPPFVPFARQTLNRPWTGRAPLPKSKKMLPELDSFNPPKPGTKGVKYVQPPGPFFMANGPDYRASTREEILGEPLTKDEKYELLEKSIRCTRQVNLGRDGLTHNMLELIHTHWKRRRVCKIKCKGVPTVDMNNVCHYLEDKTGGKIIHHIGGVVHLFRGRNYNYKSRPKFPLMLWKPATPVYPKLILRAPEGLTVEEADALRRKGRHLPAICKLGKNGVYFNLVKQIRKAFEEIELVRINCRGMKPTDYKRIGAKLKDLVPCVLLSFDKEHILMWRGKEYKVKNPIDSAPAPSAYGNDCVSDHSTNSRVADNQLSDQIVCTNLGESTTSLYTELANQRNVSSSKDAALEDTMVTSQHSEPLEDELNRSHISEQSREFMVLAEKGRHDFDDSKDETSIEVKDSSELGNVSKRSEHIHASDMEGQSNTTNVPEYAGNNSSTNSAAIVVNSSETSSESLCFPSAGVGVFDAKIMETVGKDSLDLLSKLDHQKQNDMHGVANVYEDKDSKEKGILTIKEGNGCSETAVAIEHLWQQAIESRIALLLDESGLDPDTVLKKTDDFAQAASPGPYVTYKQALSARKGSRHTKRAVKDEERNKFDGNKTSQHINKKESEEIPPFSDMVPLGMLPVDDLAKLLLAP